MYIVTKPCGVIGMSAGGERGGEVVMGVVRGQEGGRQGGKEEGEKRTRGQGGSKSMQDGRLEIWVIDIRHPGIHLRPFIF